MKFYLLIIFTSFIIGSKAQNNPVQWELKQEGDSVKACAQISEGWHMYALELPSDEGPIPTELNYNDEGVNHGNWKAPEYHQNYDPNFDMEVYYYENRVCFSHFYDGRKLEVSVYYMVCNDEMCMPPNDEVLMLDNEK